MHNDAMVGGFWQTDAVFGSVAEFELAVDGVNTLQKKSETRREGHDEAIAVQKVEEWPLKQRRWIARFLGKRKRINGSAKENAIEVVRQLRWSNALAEDSSVPGGEAVF